MGSVDDAVTQLKGIVANLSNLVTAFKNGFPRITGSFTMTAAATATITQPNIAANSIVTLMPTNAAAGTLMGSAKALYISSLAAGASFTVATASGAAAAGTETFNYTVVNPG